MMAKVQKVDFWKKYSDLCIRSRICPLKSVMKHIKGTELVCQVERIRKEHWPFLLTALSTDNSLTKVYFHSDQPPGVDKKELGQNQRPNKWCFPVPYGLTIKNINDICKCIAQLALNSEVLRTLKFQNICFRREDILYLAEGLKNSNIEHFSIPSCQIPDDCFETLCQSLHYSPLVSVDFSSCSIDRQRMNSVCNLIKAHSMQSNTEMFPHTLRYQLPVLDEIKGLRRVSLNDNEIGDAGVKLLTDCLVEDIWIKAVDLQNCCLEDEGAQCILMAARSNVSLQVVDVRLNNISESLLTRISLQMSLNNANKEVKYTLGSMWKLPVIPKRAMSRRSCTKTKVLKHHLSTIAKTSKRNYKSPKNEMRNYLKTMCDKAVCTQENRDAIEEELNQTKQYLSDQIKSCGILEHRLKKCKLENVFLREQINSQLEKQRKRDDHILIDYETFMEIKCTFEKFKRFLAVTKEYGLWETIKSLGLNFDVGANPLDNGISIPTTSHNERKIHEKRSDSSMSNYSLRGDMLSPSQQLLNKIKDYNFGQSVNNMKNDLVNPPSSNKTSKKMVQKPSTVDKELVQKVLKEVRENYGNSNDSHRSSNPVHNKVIKTSNESKSLKSLLSLAGTRRLHREKFPLIVRNPEISNINMQKHSSSFPHRKRQVEKSTEAIEPDAKESERYNSGDKNRTNSSLASSSVHQQYSSELDVNTGYKKLSGGKSQKESDSIPSSSSVRSRSLKNSHQYLHSETDTVSGSEKNLTPPKATAISFNNNGHSGIDSNKNKILTSSSVQDKSKRSGSYSKRLQSSISSVSSHSSTYKAKSNLTLSSKDAGQSEKSYLESVSDASTDQDVKSLSQSEVFNLQESVRGSEASGDTNKSQNKDETEKETASSLDEKNSEILEDPKPSDIISKSFEVYIGEKTGIQLDEQVDVNKSIKHVQQNNPAKFSSNIHSDSSVPSLSDITTVSSRSLNTDSIMAKLD